jgi:hypothetical protein
MLKSFVLVSCLSLTAMAQSPQCSGVHVWYSLANDSNSNWSIQISRLYENNISFVDENCTPLNLSEKLNLNPKETRHVGMTVTEAKGFDATYSFMGVQSATSQGQLLLPKSVSACVFLVAPYAPAQMDRLDWRLNNADCYSDHYGTEMHFK